MRAATPKGPDKLLPQHGSLLQDSAISQEVVEARGYRSVTTKAELRRLGFKDRQCLVPALRVPIYGVTGEIVNYQIRPDIPRIDADGGVG